jgi:hypothetical protein
MARLADQFREALHAFQRLSIAPALIGGMALSAHRVVRATRDIDFLVAAEDGDTLHEILLELGYRCVHRSDDAAKYLRGDEGLDVLYAHRPVARRLLHAAVPRDTGLGRCSVMSVEGLIGFKLQAVVNDPARLRDLEDIRLLLQQHRNELDLSEVREYFVMFDRELLFDQLLDEINAA